jgi:hypothetical protein
MSSNILSAVRLRPRAPRWLQGLHGFSRNPNNYNNLGDPLFARQSTQETTTDMVRTQFCHSTSSSLAAELLPKRSPIRPNDVMQRS